jgi:hypothetical protein
MKMKSFHQKTILHRVDCCLVYTEEQKEFYSSFHRHVFLLTTPPREVASIVRTAKSIFIHPDGFDCWIDVLQVLDKQHPLEVKLFIFAGSDLTITDEHIELWTMLFPKTMIWIQNYVGSLANCSIFPIGVNHSIEFEEQEKKEPLILSHFTAENSKERKDLKEYLETEPSLAKYCLEKLPVETYLERMATAYFSVCPTGNGYDSLRFWESLSVGTIPLVLSSPFIEALMEHHPELPFMILESWKDLPSFISANTEKVYDSYMGMSNLEILTEDYWIKKFENILGISAQRETSNTKDEVSLYEMPLMQSSQGSEPIDHETHLTNPLQ